MWGWAFKLQGPQVSYKPVLPSRAQRNHAMYIVMGNVKRAFKNDSDSDYSEKRDHNSARRAHSKTIRKRIGRKKVARFLSQEELKSSLEPQRIVHRSHTTNVDKRKLIYEFDEFARSRGDLPIWKLFILFQKEAAPSIPASTMRGFIERRQSILLEGRPSAPPLIRNSRVSADRLTLYRKGRFESLENVLYLELLDKRQDGLLVARDWLMARMKQLLTEWVSLKKPHQCTEGWLAKFMKRFHLTLRKASNTHPMTIVERVPLLEEFYKEVKRLCRPSVGCVGDFDKFGLFPLSRRIHFDEVPFELRGTLNYTVEHTGAGRVQIKQPKIQLDFRVCSLCLYFVAELKGDLWLRPSICFRLVPSTVGTGGINPRSPKSGRVKAEAESLRRDFPEIDIYFQRKGYYDAPTTLCATNAFVDSLPEKGPWLVCCDNLGAHLTEDVKTVLTRAEVTLLLTPKNCTDVCAVTDAGLGRSIKLLMRKRFKKHFSEHLQEWTEGRVNPETRRRLSCEWLRDSIIEFYKNDGQRQVLKAFQRCGLAGAYNGSEDHLIKLDGFPSQELDLDVSDHE